MVFCFVLPLYPSCVWGISHFGPRLSIYSIRSYHDGAVDCLPWRSKLCIECHRRMTPLSLRPFLPPKLNARA
ncbi:hypothetical protein F5879DRAFT_952492 [Lentinula edodes]|nr:hypothetical protein F5879DRAFT_952492 [Lentinula edodes]